MSNLFSRLAKALAFGALLTTNAQAFDLGDIADGVGDFFGGSVRMADPENKYIL